MPVDARRIAASSKASAERSPRRKGAPLQSAMSMPTFSMNRTGKTVSDAQRKRLENAKIESRAPFDRPEPDH